MFAALSDILEAAVSVGVDTAAGLLFDTEGSAGLASLRQSAEDLTEPDELRRAAETLCHAAEDDEQRRQLLAPDGAEADQFFMDLLLRSICSSDVVRMPVTITPASVLNILRLSLADACHSHRGSVQPADTYLGHPSVSRGNRCYEWNALTHASRDCWLAHELAGTTRGTRPE